MPRQLRATGTGSSRPRRPVTCKLVGVAGFEPAASSSRTKRAAKLRYTPAPRADCPGRTSVSLADALTPLRGHIQAATGVRETQSAPYQRRAWPVTAAMVAKSRSWCSTVRPNSSAVAAITRSTGPALRCFPMFVSSPCTSHARA